MSVDIAHPSLGPPILVFVGLQIPVAAMLISLIALWLSRYISPSHARRLTIWQERALTALLSILLIVIVSGNAPFVGDGQPLEIGTAVAWGMGLGWSGMVVFDIIGARIMNGLRAMVGSDM